MVVVRYEAPAAGKQGLDFQPLLLATLRSADAVNEDAAVVDTKIAVINRGVFEGPGAESSTFEKAAAAHELAANGSVQPVSGSQIKSITGNGSLERAPANVGNEEAGLAYFAAGGGGGVREPDEGHAEKTEVGVNQCHSFIETDPRVGRVELPLGALGVADGDPAAVDEVYLSREAFDVPCFEVKRIVGNQNRWIGPPLDLDVAANVVKQAVSGADVVMSLLGVEVLVAVIELDVA